MALMRGLALLMPLVVAGALAGSKIATWYLNETNPAAELETGVYPVVGGALGAVAALAIGLGAAYLVGKHGAGDEG
ncbi:MAG: hypothetical protein ABR613_01840 [Actinomycetota bacterium]